MNANELFEQAKQFFTELQQQMCAELEKLETAHQEDNPRGDNPRGDNPAQTFTKDEWQSKLGRGSTNMLQGGALWEKAGVAFSEIASDKLPPTASQRNQHLANKPYQACGISIVIHPRNPYVPTSHANLRMFAVDAEGKDDEKNWWFGGGFDLTPYYIEQEDCDMWHGAAKQTCDEYDKDLHQQLKQNCDEYFYLPHRQEARGIGGIFFDDLNLWEADRCLAFVKSVGGCYKDTYLAMADKLRNKEYGARETEFQQQRRGRYVEFNLLHDRGTLFGIQSGGRTESILMSLPPRVSWDYKRSYPGDSPEGQLIARLQRATK